MTSSERVLAPMRKKALHLRETTDKALLIVCGCNYCRNELCKP